MAKHNEIKPTASFGDLVTVKGYGDRVFMVEAFTIEELNEPSGITPNIVYDLTCPYTFEFIIGEQTDITVVCKALTAHIYLEQHPPADYEINPTSDFEMPTYNLQVITPADVAPKPKRKTQRQKQAEIDVLLDELNVLTAVIEICGTDEDYAVRIADVKRKLKEATA